MKHFYVLLALVFCPLGAMANEPAKACACDQSPAKALIKKTALASTAFIGKVEREGGERLIRVSHTWTPYRAIFKAPQDLSCALTLDRGKRYLILSSLSVEQIEKTGLGLTVCDTVAFRLGIGTETAISQMADRKMLDQTSPNPAWLSCVKSEDCVDARAVCGDTMGINHRYQVQFDEWARSVASRLQCSGVDETVTDKPKFKCVEGLCSL